MNIKQVANIDDQDAYLKKHYCEQIDLSTTEQVALAFLRTWIMDRPFLTVYLKQMMR